MSKRELADFLRQRRELLGPEQAGLGAGHGRARRTPGLRREEVAGLAGMSVSYYERLEQARGPRPSAQVLAALGSALRLTDAERTHLSLLAGQSPAAGGEPVAEVPATVRQLLDRLGPVPGYVLNPKLDILAWNAMAAALITDFAQLAPEERNVVRLSVRYGGTLCSAPPGELGNFARQSAAGLRAAGARYPDTPELGALVREFAAHDPDFAAAWRDHEVREPSVLRKRITHAELGVLELDCQSLLVPGHDLRLVLYTAVPGSAAERALARMHRALPGVIG